MLGWIARRGEGGRRRPASAVQRALLPPAIRPLAILALAGLCACVDSGGLVERLSGGNAARPAAGSVALRYEQLAAARAPALLMVAADTGQIEILRRLSTGTDGVESWITQSGLGFDFQGGLLVATRGLGGDMAAAEVSESLALLRAGRDGRAERFLSFFDGSNGVVTRAYVCDIRNLGNEVIASGTLKLRARKLKETCTGADKSFANLYWFGPDGKLAQSEQYAGVTHGMVVLRDFIE